MNRSRPAMTPRPPAPWSEQRRLLYAGIPVRVAFQPADADLEAELWASLEDIDGVFNDHRDDTEIGRINAAGAGTFKLSPRLAAAFAHAAELQQLTGGAFSVTTGALRRLWRHAARSGHPPDPAALAAARAALRPETWHCSGDRLQVLDPGVRFDFGGLVKGMAVDDAMKRLAAAGAAAALVQCGGETTCRGLSRRGRPHLLGIPDPQHPDDRMWCAIRDPGTGLSASTSGNYRNQAATPAPTPAHHVFDPNTGAPVAGNTLSVSVVFPSCGRNGLADGLATAGTVAGWQHLLPLVSAHGGEALVLTLEHGRVAAHPTAGWRRLAPA